MSEKRGFGDRVNRDFAKFPKLAKLEESVVGMILLHPEYLKTEVDNTPVTEDDFKSEFCQQIAGYVRKYSDEGAFSTALLNRDFNEEEAARAYAMMTQRSLLEDNSIQTFTYLVRELRAESEKLTTVEDKPSIDSILNTLNQKKEQ